MCAHTCSGTVGGSSHVVRWCAGPGRTVSANGEPGTGNASFLSRTWSKYRPTLPTEKETL